MFASLCEAVCADANEPGRAPTDDRPRRTARATKSGDDDEEDDGDG